MSRRAPILVLAPMAGYTDRAMRLMCAEQGADMTVTEMVSSKAIHYKDKKTDTLAELDNIPCRQAVQIFGSDPDIMAEAAAYCTEKFHPDMIDINMGCPMKKIVSNGDGSALMRDPALAGRITRAVSDATDLPVSVKIRSGWSKDEKNAPEFAKMLEQNGASLITVHARTKEQLYAPPVDIDIIGKVKRSVSIPVIGNGGITSASDAVLMLRETGCDGVAVGQGALGDPWLFARIKAALDGKELPLPSPAERIEAARRHLALEIEMRQESAAVRECRGILAHYIHGLRTAAAARLKINQCLCREDVEAVLDTLLDENI